MGWTIGIPSIKLNNSGKKSKHCGDFKRVAEEALEERNGRDPDIDRNRADKNIYEGFRTAAELISYSKKHVDTMRDASGRKIRSDAVVMCATIIKPPMAYIAGLSEEEQKRFLDDSVEGFEKIVDPNRIKSKAYHFDEQGAHVHLFWEPITADGRLCAKEVHNLKFFGRLNREMPEHLRSKGWEIDDCKAFDKAEFDAMTPEQQKAFLEEKYVTRGRSSKKYKEQQDAAKQVIEKEIDDLEAKVNEIDAKIKELENKKIDQEKVPDQGEGFVIWCMRHIQGVQKAVEDFCKKMHKKYLEEQEKARIKAIREAREQKTDLDKLISEARSSINNAPGKVVKEVNELER